VVPAAVAVGGPDDHAVDRAAVGRLVLPTAKQVARAEVRQHRSPWLSSRSGSLGSSVISSSPAITLLGGGGILVRAFRSAGVQSGVGARRRIRYGAGRRTPASIGDQGHVPVTATSLGAVFGCCSSVPVSCVPPSMKHARRRPARRRSRELDHAQPWFFETKLSTAMHRAAETLDRQGMYWEVLRVELQGLVVHEVALPAIPPPAILTSVNGCWPGRRCVVRPCTG
jgi:hypothetical protein